MYGNKKRRLRQVYTESGKNLSCGGLMVSILNLFEVNIKFSPIENQRMGISDNFRNYLERLKAEREKLYGKTEARNINPLRQFGKTEVVNTKPSSLKQFAVEI